MSNAVPFPLYTFPASDLILTSEVRKLFPEPRPTSGTLIIWAKRGSFPPYFKISPRKFYWSRSQVEAWFREKKLSPVLEDEGV